MKVPVSEFLLRFREPLSAAGSAMLMLSLLLLSHSLAPTNRHPATSSTPIELSFSVPEIPLPTEQQVAPPPLTATPALQRNVSHAPSKEPITPRNTVAAPAEPATQVGAAPAASPPVQAAPAAPGLAIPLAAPSVAPVNSGRNAEAIYAGKVRANLQTSKRYPTGREASLQRPTGTSVVWFMVRRSGELVEAGIETSSGSMLLDNAALATVRRSIYPVFPDEAWSGKAQQRFTVELNFVPAH